MSMIRIRKSAARTEDGASTAEYATTCGVGVGFAGVVYKLLTSETGQSLLENTFDAVRGLLPF